MQLAPVSAQAAESLLYLKNRAAQGLIEGQFYSDALTQLSQALEMDPQFPVAHFNMGVAFHGLQQLEQAAASYQLAIENAGRSKAAAEILFKANFNLGTIEGGKKNVDLALQYYQEALKYNPDSKETKINIELLMQQQQQDEQKSKDQKQDQDNKDQQKNQDQKNQEDSKDQKDKQDKKDQKPEDQKEQEKKENKPEEMKPEEKKPGEYEKPQPQEFKSEELSKSDVNKILDEIRQQEQKIRMDFQRKESKEKPREKSW